MSPGPIDTPAMENMPPEMKEQFRSMIPRKELGGIDIYTLQLGF
jgi:hypothetical protein